MWFSMLHCMVKVRCFFSKMELQLKYSSLKYISRDIFLKYIFRNIFLCFTFLPPAECMNSIGKIQSNTCSWKNYFIIDHTWIWYKDWGPGWVFQLTVALVEKKNKNYITIRVDNFGRKLMSYITTSKILSLH